MEEKLYIVVHGIRNGQWRSDEVFTERRLADNHAEIKSLLDSEPKWEYFVVEATVCRRETEAEAEARLGVF
jgi:hypothetical protein